MPESFSLIPIFSSQAAVSSLSPALGWPGPQLSTKWNGEHFQWQSQAYPELP